MGDEQRDFIKNNFFYFHCRFCGGKLKSAKVNQGFVKITCPDCKKMYYVDSSGKQEDVTRCNGMPDYFLDGKLYSVCRNKNCRQLTVISDTGSVEGEFEYITHAKCNGAYWLDITGQMRDYTYNTDVDFSVDEYAYFLCHNNYCREPLVQKIRSKANVSVFCPVCKSKYKLELSSSCSLNGTDKGESKNNSKSKEDSKEKDGKKTSNSNKTASGKESQKDQQTNTGTDYSKQSNIVVNSKTRKVNFLWGGEFENRHDIIMTWLNRGAPVYPIVGGEIFGNIMEADRSIAISTNATEVAVGNDSGYAEAKLVIPAGSKDYNVYVRRLSGRLNISFAEYNSPYVSYLFGYIEDLLKTNRFRGKFGRENANGRVELYASDTDLEVRFRPKETKGIKEWATGYRSDKIPYSSIMDAASCEMGKVECFYANAVMLEFIRQLDLYDAWTDGYAIILAPF